MGVIKRCLRSEAALTGLSALAAVYIRLVRWTGRWQVINGEVLARHWAARRPFIGCFWHGRLMMIRYLWATELPLAVLISRHRDGRLIARTVERLGIQTIAGSSAKGAADKGGAAALREVVRALKSGISVGITPDGPRGPRMRASPGAVAAARLSGAPLVPVAVAMWPRKVMGSWDRFLLALPFGRGVYVCGEPIEVPADADATQVTALTQRLEDALNQLSQRADALVGCVPIAPALAASADRSSGDRSSDGRAEGGHMDAAAGSR